MRCHYEVLDIERNADDADIKRSYRKLALKNHPDKNPDNLEECTRIFHEVQCAYEVLTDKQERAFYDKHREAILKGGDDYVDEAIDILHYFNPGVYSGFNDGTKGFYTVFRDVFLIIAEEDEPYLEGDSDYEVPEFGDSKSAYDEVVKPFYSYWLGYCTKKSYVWKDKYDLRQAPNRPTQRLMEKENKKFRDTAKKERNEEVRALVLYIRKRDKRVQKYRKELEEKQAENQLKLEKKREEDIRKNNEVLNDYKEQEWMAFDHSKLDSIDSHFDEQFGSKVNVSDDSDDEIIEHFYCIACDKNFKSEKALANHEKSKKHRQNVELIKSELGDELLEDLHIDTDKMRGEKENLDISDGYERLSSLNLPENVVKLNVIEKTEKTSSGGDKQQHEDGESMIPHTDSLIYTKIKGSSASMGAVKVKEKKKKKKSKPSKANEGDEEETEEEWQSRYDHFSLSSQDSLAMPRKKTKKQELKESVHRVRQGDEIQNTPDGLIDAPLGRSKTKSSTTDSLRLKRPTKSDRKKGRRKLLDIGEDSNSDDEDDDDDEDEVFDGDRNTLNVNANRSAGLLDSIRYNKEHMEHHGKHILQQKHEERKERSSSNLEKEDDKEEDTIEGRTGSLQRVPDSIRYNKDHMEHHGKSILQQKHSEDKEDSSLHRVADSIRYNKDHIEHHGKNILVQKHSQKGSQQNNDESDQPEENLSNEKSSNKARVNSLEGPYTGLFSCIVCEKDFPTRNKLFEHIQADGHAVIKENGSSKSRKGKNKKK